ncbi:MAG: phosphoribosyltransferase [Bacteroidia bacterium]|nr:phosphoribosyltransferase [Bacteroidia bacterium]
MATQLLNETQIENRIRRIAFQIYEDNFEADEIILAGIVKGGYVLAAEIEKRLKEICEIKITLIEINLDKNSQAQKPIQVALPNDYLQNKTVVIVDDVLNSGKTLTYAMLPFLNADVKKIRTVLLVDRDHKRYPVHADFVGFELSTTLKEHVTVNLTPGNKRIMLS